MTFLVSDELKDLVTEKDLFSNVYHESPTLDLTAVFYSEIDIQCSHDVISVSRYDDKIDVEIDLGIDQESINYLLNENVIQKFELIFSQISKPAITLKNATIELVKIKKVNDRNSYFARIIIAYA